MPNPIDGYYLQSAMKNGLFLEVGGGKPVEHSPIEIGTPLLKPVTQQPGPSEAELTKALSQIWYFVPSASGSDTFFIQTALGDNLVLDVDNATAKSGTPIQVYPQKAVNEAANQLWKFVLVTLPSPPPPPGGISLPEQFGYFIESQLNNDLVIDVTGANDEPGAAKLQIYTKKPTGNAAEIAAAANQLWWQPNVFLNIQ